MTTGLVTTLSNPAREELRGSSAARWEGGGWLIARGSARRTSAAHAHCGYPLWLISNGQMQRVAHSDLSDRSGFWLGCCSCIIVFAHAPLQDAAVAWGKKMVKDELKARKQFEEVSAASAAGA